MTSLTKIDEIALKLGDLNAILIDDYTHRDGVLMGYQHRLGQMLSEKESPRKEDLLVSLCSEIRSFIWEKLHSFAWNEPGLSIYRDWLSMVTSLLVVLSYRIWLTRKKRFASSDLKALIHLLDLGLLLSSPDNEVLQALMGVVYDDYSVLKSEEKKEQQEKEKAKDEVSDKSRERKGRREVKRKRRNVFPRRYPANFLKSSSSLSVPCIEAEDLLGFYETFFLCQKPVIIKGAMQRWRALTKWRDLDYLIGVAGERTVPVELGSSYLSSGAAMKLMTMKDFIHSYILSSKSDGDGDGVGYLAQHAVFDQMPVLKRDFALPDHCALLHEGSESIPSDEEEREVLVQAWFGPIGTLSPLHYDSYHNILAQVVGSKTVRLFSPQHSHLLQPLQGKMKNNSVLDLSLLSVAESLEGVSCFDILLNEGDCLFIPRWWWHHVTAIDKETNQELLLFAKEPTHYLHKTSEEKKSNDDEEFSFSVNFWWGRRVDPLCAR